MEVKLNTLAPNYGAKKKRKRVGRSAASGWGKTCGKGNNGQKSRSGGKVRASFEGGQMPLQMRLPKFGFNSRIAMVTQEIRLHELNACSEGDVTLSTLKENGLISTNIKRAKIFLSGEIQKTLHIKGIMVTKGAKEAIIEAGGSIE